MRRAASVLLVCVVAGQARAQVELDLGGTGADGPLNITADTTLALPPDGVLQLTTLTVAAGATLRFTPNARNTPVQIVATGDVVINGTIDVAGQPGVAGQGGAGGPAGGRGGVASLEGAPSPPALLGPMRGGVGGIGTAKSADTGMCTALGAGGPGGGGRIFIRSHSAIRATAVATITAAAGAWPPTLLPTNASFPSGCHPHLGTRGADGHITLVAPLIAAGGLSLVAAGAAVNALDLTAAPSLSDSSGSALAPQLSQTLSAYAAPAFAPRIVSIDGSALPTGADSYLQTYGPAATSTTVVTNVAGCSGRLNVVLERAGFVQGCTGSQTQYVLTNDATTTWTCPLSTTSSSGQLLFHASCGPYP